MLVQQTIKVLHRRKISSLFLKLDISKAFDSVAWTFLLEILSHLGFGASCFMVYAHCQFTQLCNYSSSTEW